MRWTAIAAAAAAAAIGVLVVSPFGGDDAGDHVAEVLEDPNATTIELTGELSGLRLVHSEAANATVLEGTGVPAPEGDDVFELWRHRRGRRLSLSSGSSGPRTGWSSS